MIVYDVQFTEPSDDAEADNALIEAVHDAAADRARHDRGRAERHDGIFGGEEGLEYSGATPANSNFVADPDDRVRQMSFKLEKLDTLAIAGVRAAG